MMDMREFQEKLEQLMELAAKQEKNLNNEQILEIFGLNQLCLQPQRQKHLKMVIHSNCLASRHCSR